MELLESAEIIEDERSREHAGVGDGDLRFFAPIAALDLSAEHLAWVVASAVGSTTGVITSINMACLKLFGYQRRELLGRNIAVLVPEPVGSVHPLIVERFKVSVASRRKAGGGGAGARGRAIVEGARLDRAIVEGARVDRGTRLVSSWAHYAHTPAPNPWP